MRYEIWGEQLPAVTMHLEAGESVYTQRGGLSWMSDGINMETNMKGGLGKALGRMFSGESLFMATYTAQRPGAQITFASSMPGNIRALQIGQG
ncbi:MAG: AIM24 family protein, partial [Clostridia bacterium]|nr:AIM24 family protein [Clostridia bacterium]